MRYLILCGVAALVMAAVPVRAAAGDPAPAGKPRLDVNGVALPPGAVARVGSAVFRHPAPVAIVLFAGPDRLLCATKAGEVFLWDLAKGRLLRRWNLPGTSYT